MNDLYAGYGRNHAVLRGLNGTIAEGHIYGLLGANGSGKTTLMKTWAGALHPISGSVDVFGNRPEDRKVDFLASTVFMPDEMSFPRLSVAAFEKIYGRFYPKFSHEEFSYYLNMLRFSFDVRLDHLSTGNRKKFFAAFAMACNPSLLLMDEPTNGLDIPGKSQFRKLVINEMSDTRSMVNSTHQVKDMENLIDHVMILEQKGILLNASVNEICRKLCFKPSDTPPDESAWSSMPTFHGYSIMKPNTENEDTELNLELLFNGTLAHPDEIRHLFTT